MILTRSTFVRNVVRGADGLGGALFNSGRLLATNITVTENRAEGATSPTTGGRGIGGGIYAATATEVHYATLARNQAFADGGNTAASGVLFLKNTILLAAPGTPQVTGVLADGGYNLSSDNSRPLTASGSRNNLDPSLGPLATATASAPGNGPWFYGLIAP